MKHFSIVAGIVLAAAAAALFAPAALAQAVALAGDEGTKVAIPIGQWIDAGVGVVFAAVAGAAAVAMKSAPAHIQWALTFTRANENFGKALAYARSELRNKYGKFTWTPDVKLEGVAIALRYGRDHFPKMLEQFGLDRSKEKLQARLEEYIERAIDAVT